MLNHRINNNFYSVVKPLDSNPIVPKYTIISKQLTNYIIYSYIDIYNPFVPTVLVAILTDIGYLDVPPCLPTAVFSGLNLKFK